MSNYKINGVDLDNYFQLRNGVTPLSPITGFKFNGGDLNQRYLSISDPTSVPGPKINVYTANGIDLGDIFSTRHDASTSTTKNSNYALIENKTSFTSTFRVTYASEEVMNLIFQYSGGLNFQPYVQAFEDSTYWGSWIFWILGSEVRIRKDLVWFPLGDQEGRVAGVPLSSFTSSFQVVASGSVSLLWPNDGETFTFNLSGRKVSNNILEFQFHTDRIFTTINSHTLASVHYTVSALFHPNFPAPTITITNPMTAS